MEALSERVLNRLTQYHTILREKDKKGIEFVTSSLISALLEIDETQVRKDISSINGKGKPKVGYNVKELKTVIEGVLGYKTIKKAIVIGAGNLGTALSGYSKFFEFGLDIAALFDEDKAKIGSIINNKEVYSIDKIEEISKRYGANIAILTTPNKVAQRVCDLLVQSGIKYIWNFAPIILKVPKDVKVWNENLIASFIQFCAIEGISS